MAENNNKIARCSTPCYNCECREAGCHSKCEKYAIYREKVDNKNQKRAEYLLSQRRPVNARTKRNGQV